uniref:Uncharacterized protein n=1 Tax=Anguilla anguilla TaxID=7936 RepID=A0A0E9TLX9_ANGAN
MYATKCVERQYKMYALTDLSKIRFLFNCLNGVQLILFDSIILCWPL